RDHRDLPTNQFGRQRRQPVALIFGEPVDDFDVLALNEACVLEALAECAQTVGLCVSRCGIEKSDDRHCRLLRWRREWPPGRRAAECGQQFPPSDGDCHTPLPREVRKGNDTTPLACSLHVQGGQDAACFDLSLRLLLPPPALCERRHRSLARRLVAVHRSARYAAGGGGGGFGGLGGGGLGGRGGKMATRNVKCVLVVVISVLFCPNLPRPARQRGRAWEAATTAAAAKAAANNS